MKQKVSELIEEKEVIAKKLELVSNYETRRELERRNLKISSEIDRLTNLLIKG